MVFKLQNISVLKAALISVLIHSSRVSHRGQ